MIQKYSGYDLTTPLDAIRPDYSFDVSCQGSVPQAIRAFLEGNSYEECVRLAVSIGGDTDTIACMAEAIAEAYYGIPKEIKQEGLTYIDPFLKSKIQKFRSFYHEHCRRPDNVWEGNIRALTKGPYGGGCPELEAAISSFNNDAQTGTGYQEVLQILKTAIDDELEVIIPVDIYENGDISLKPVQFEEGILFAPAFTNANEFYAGPETSSVPILFSQLIRFVSENPDFQGISINHWGDRFVVHISELEKLI